MSDIHVLEKSISELIAAGEVIERPASIVKELTENSIDAGATALTVEIKNGGISYLRVTDNGCGIDAKQVSTAFLRHATSKISKEIDLDNIKTLGFRGEALASIAAVSKVTITTKTSLAQFATQLTLTGGVAENPEEVGASNGTTIIVKDLFYNVPARLKFLKKDITEANTISGIVDKLALSHPEISFKFINEGKVKLHTPGNGDLLSAIHCVFGSEFAKSLIEVSYECNGIIVKGYTSSPKFTRTNRLMQHFFVNERYVKSKVCATAIEEGYKNSIMIGKFPLCVLYISVPYNSVDVNVHPSKIEIRFTNERIVFDAIYFAIRNAIIKNDELTKTIDEYKMQSKEDIIEVFKEQPSVQIKLEDKGEPLLILQNQSMAQPMMKNIIIEDNKKEYKVTNDEMKSEDALSKFSYITKSSFDQKQQQKQKIILEEPQDEEIAEEVELQIVLIGELFKTYILFEIGENFVMLDKHAAHERILFEKLKKNVSTDERQILLKPIIVTVSKEENAILLTNTDLLCKMGFVIEEFGNCTVSVREVPLVLAKYDIPSILLDIAENISNNKIDISSQIFENLLHSIACRCAIKANDTTTQQEIIALLKMVMQDEKIRHCPHGRPIVTIMSKQEIEKQFGRIQ